MVFLKQADFLELLNLILCCSICMGKFFTIGVSLSLPGMHVKGKDMIQAFIFCSTSVECLLTSLTSLGCTDGCAIIFVMLYELFCKGS